MSAPQRSRPTELGAALDPDALAALEEQHRFLVRSLDDLEREHDAGDLDDADYESLKADYAARSVAVGDAIDAGRARFVAARRTSSTGRRIALVAGVAVFALLCGGLVAFTAGRRQPGQTATGNAQLTDRDKLSQCFASGQAGQLLDATKCYGEIIKSEPDNAEALTYLGWFLYLAAEQSNQPQLAADAPGFLARAVQADPTYPDAHMFRAVMAANEGRTADALAELDTLDALHPPADVQQLADQLRAQVTAPSTTGSTATSLVPGSATTTSVPG